MDLVLSVGEQTDPVDHAGRVADATRHLCAGVYLDQHFRDEVIHRVHNDPYHRLAPSYGFDLVPIVDHAWCAWVLQTSRRVCVLAVLAISLTSNAPASIMAVSGVGLLWLARRTLRAALAVLRLKAKAVVSKWMRRQHATIEDDLREQVRLLAVCVGGCAMLIVVPELIAGFLHISLTNALPGAVLLLFMMAAVLVTGGVLQQLALNSVHRAMSLRPRRLSKRQQVIDAQQDPTYVVHRHDATKPFVGSGLRVYQWQPPLVVQLRRHGKGNTDQQEYVTSPFKAHELVSYLKHAMAPIGDPTDPGRMLGLEIRDRLYIDETNLLSERACLLSEPTTAEIENIIDDSHGTTHHYLEIRVTGNRELVVTTFLRVLVQGRSLTVDFAACALTGTPVEYRVLNTITATRKGAVVRSALRGLGGLPLIGSRRGLREINALAWEDAHLDKVAVSRTIKILEERLLVAIKEFLRSKGVDISILEERVTTIINEGVISFGPTNMNQTAVGQNATVQAAPSGPAGGAGTTGGGQS